MEDVSMTRARHHAHHRDILAPRSFSCVDCHHKSPRSHSSCHLQGGEHETHNFVVATHQGETRRGTNVCNTSLARHLTKNFRSSGTLCIKGKFHKKNSPVGRNDRLKHVKWCVRNGGGRRGRRRYIVDAGPTLHVPKS